MAKKPTIQQKNEAKLEQLLKQKVSGTNGFLNENFKRFIAGEMISAANNQKKAIKTTDSLQKRYDSYKKYYDKLFTTGMTGHALYTGTIYNIAKKEIKEGTEYYIKEKGKEKKVSAHELAYKIELLAHKLSTKHDVAFTKFKPVYYLKGKGKYKIVIEIPDINEVDFEEMTTEEILEWFDDNNTEIIISDPAKVKNITDRERFNKAKTKRQKLIQKSKQKHYKQWKKKKNPKKRTGKTKK